MTHTKNNRHSKKQAWGTIRDPQSAGYRLAEAVTDAWYAGGRGSSDDAVCVGVVAALAMLRARGGLPAEMITGPRDPGQERGMPHVMVAGRDMPVAVDLRDFLMNCPDSYIIKLLREIWSFFWINRPDLAMHVKPFAGWLNLDDEDGKGPGKHETASAARVARAAVKYGLLNDCGGGESLAEHYDIIGAVYTMTRSAHARHGSGEFYTPAAVCYMMAKMTLGGPDGLKPGQSIMEPALGTGGMWLGMARAMRDERLDPADFAWVGNDIQRVSIAGAAVNCQIWGLGFNVLIGVADSIADPDWQGRAWEDRRKILEYHGQAFKGAQMLALLRQVGGDGGDPADGQRGEPHRHAGPVPDWLAALTGHDPEALFDTGPAGAEPAAARRGGRGRPAPAPAPGSDAEEAETLF